MSENIEREPLDGQLPASSLIVAGIGAVVASIPSVERLLSALPPSPGIAFIVVLQDNQPADVLRLLALLTRQARLPVEIGADGTQIAADRIYLAPADTILTLDGDRLRAAANGERGLLDTFLLSLAEQHRKHAIAITLAGLGSDGTLGVASVKVNGGLTLAEAFEDAPPAARGQPTTAEGIVDFVMPPDRIARHIVAYVDHLSQSVDLPAPTVAEGPQPFLARIATILRAKTGHDFHGCKQNTFFRRIRRRMQVVQINEVEAYIEFLKSDADEVQHLFQDLLIGVTQFFRDGPEFALLEREVVPWLFTGKTAGDHLRVWVLGCATGEEAYSIAILLREHMAHLDVVPNIQIFATDIDARALATARTGRFPASIARDISPERLARWFVREANTYCVVKELREMCVFSAHDLIKDAPFSRIDLVSCRNLLVDLNTNLQDRIIPLFHFSLKPGGFLFLGPSENVTRHAKLFVPIDRKHRIFRRQDAATRLLPEFPLVAGHGGTPEERGQQRQRTGDTGLGKRAERLAERYAPAYVVVDEHAEILHFSGRTGRYLEPTAGAANLNLLKLVHRDLRLDLRAALHKAEGTYQAVKVERLQIDSENERQMINLVVQPIVHAAEGPASFLVLFQEIGVASFGDAEHSLGYLRDEHVQRLESELRLTKERLQATIEELERTNEELQSANEELQTVNGELSYRVNELAKTNSDLKSLLESTQVPTIFLDNDLRVKTFTPSVTDIFHLNENDSGRPITHIASRISYDGLEDDVRKVLRTLGTVEREVGDPRGGSRYLVRVLPYRSIDNFIAGAVLAFLDITPAVRAEDALRKSEQRLALAQAAGHIGSWTRDAGTEAQWWSPTMFDLHGLSPADAPPTDAQVAFVDEDERDWFEQAIAAAYAGEGDLNIEYRIRHPVRGERWLTAIGQVEARVASGQPLRLVGVTRDISDQKQAERRSAPMLADLQHRVRNTLAVVRSLAARSLETSRSLDDFRSHFEGRLSALGRTHGVLARLPGGGVDLEEVVRDELLAQAVPDNEHMHIAGPQISLRQKAAELFGLALHELVTNAVKYGALANPPGDISVTWRIFETSGGPRLTLEWLEKNPRPMRQRQRRRGFGSTLIEQGLPYDLGAATSLDITPDGVRCTIELPMTSGLIIAGAAEVE